jgi:hypothetical protein
MKKKLKLLFIGASLLLFLAAPAFVSAYDTGTYKIIDYRVELTPRSDGRVEIAYYQKWAVTGGHMPWITVGAESSNFVIDRSKNKGNIRTISPNNSTGWQGVKIDLDKDYKPGETFEVGYTLIQSKLFYADKENYRLNFTPGWFDRAVIENLTIVIHSFAKIEQIKARPSPTKIEGQDIIWTTSLGYGQRFSISFSFPKSLMPGIKSSEAKTGEVKKGVSADVVFLIIFVLIVVFIIVASLVSHPKGRDGHYRRGGRIFFGGLYGGRSGGSSGGRSAGGGGGFGGRSISCACACVACACACACAGGGGAGCTKKTVHSCPICRKKK